MTRQTRQTRHDGPLLATAVLAACLLMVAAAGQDLDPIFDTIEVDGTPTFHADDWLLTRHAPDDVWTQAELATDSVGQDQLITGTGSSNELGGNGFPVTNNYLLGIWPVMTSGNGTCTVLPYARRSATPSLSVPGSMSGPPRYALVAGTDVADNVLLPDSNACVSGSEAHWLYIAASDNPHVEVRRTAAGEPVVIWEAEDPPSDGSAAISIVRCVTTMPDDPPGCEVTTDTVVDAGPPPVSVLTMLYVGQAAALADFRSYLSGRGWGGTASTVAALVDAAPRSGCGTSDGDCRPAARLHALRALATAAGESVGAYAADRLRVAADGTWSVAP